jgi:hypothetical protein
MDEDDIKIEMGLDDRKINRQIDTLEAKLKKSLNAALGGGASGGTDRATRTLKDQEAAALRLAQAQARLATAGGNLTGAQNILSTALAKTTKETVTQVGAQTQFVRVNQQMQRETQQSASAVSALGRSTAGLVAGFGALAAIGLVSLFESVARRAVDAAISIDQQVTALTALTGSAAAARQRLDELFTLAQKTPGLTLGLAATLDAQLRVFDVSTQTINRLLDTVGRLNAISPLGNPRQFAQNLVQLVTQNFEKQDLKELVTQSPLAGQLIKEVFNVDSPINAEAVRASAKKLGITTVERLAEELAKAGAENPALKNAIEGLGTRFERLQDRLTRALAPVGTQLAEISLQLGDDLVKQVERYGNAAARVFDENRGQIIATGREIIALGVEFTKLIAGIATSPQLQEFLGKLASESARVQDLLQSTGSERAKILFGIEQGPRERAALERQGSRIATGETVAEFEDRLQRESREMLKRLEGGGGFTSPGRTGGAGGGGTGGGGLSGSRSREKTELQKAQEETRRVRERVAGLEKETSALVKQKLELLQLKLKEDQLDKALADRAFREFLKAQGKPLPPQLPNVGITDAQRRAIGLAPALGSPGAIRGAPTIAFGSDLDADRAAAAQARGELADQRLRIQEVQIQNQLNRGLLTEAEAQRALSAARQASRGELISTLEAEREAVGLNSLRGLQITEEIERLRFLGVELSNSERFARGFAGAMETVGDAFERFGQNVARALTNTKDLLNGLKNSVLQLFNDIIGQGLQNLVRNALGPLLGLGGGGGAAAGGIGNIFRTPSTFPSQIAQAFAGGGAIAAPGSISGQTPTGIFANGAFAAGLAGGGGSGGGAIGAAGGIGRIPGLSRILGGVFNRVFAGGAVSAFPALLGAQLGAGLGGQSTLGRILGGIGGSAVGLGVGFGSAVFGAGGGLAAASLAALGPIALIGAPLLIGAIFAGKAAQRKKDEEASGQFLTQALQAIDQLAAGITSGQIAAGQARSIFDTQILNPFKQQISGLKTKSVRESRLTNQVRDLEDQYQIRIQPLIAQQIQRRELSSKLIPEFATGGRMPFDGWARLHAGELIINSRQQTPELLVAAARASVPGVDSGGPTPALQPVFNVTILMGTQEQTQVFVNGLRQPVGNNAFKDEVKKLIKYGEV